MACHCSKGGTIRSRPDAGRAESREAQAAIAAAADSANRCIMALQKNVRQALAAAVAARAVRVVCALSPCRQSFNLFSGILPVPDQDSPAHQVTGSQLTKCYHPNAKAAPGRAALTQSALSWITVFLPERPLLYRSGSASRRCRPASPRCSPPGRAHRPAAAGFPDPGRFRRFWL